MHYTPSQNAKQQFQAELSYNKNNRPVQLTVSEILKENTDQLLDILNAELELKKSNLEGELYFKTLERIFIEKTNL
jgi:hypothetical protein